MELTGAIKMTEETIQSKWVFISNWLKELGAPEKVINAATEIDNALIGLGLGYNTKEWEEDYDHVSRWNRADPTTLKKLIMNGYYCSACDDVDELCSKCKLGEVMSCTPRSKHADQYFTIVRRWVEKQIRMNEDEDELY